MCEMNAIKRILGLISLMSTLLCEVSSCQWLPEVGSVRLDESSVTLKVGQTWALKASVEPSAAEYEGISWVSSDPSIATVSNTGLVSARKIGNAQITASTAGISSSPCQIQVTSTPVNGVRLDKSSVSIPEGESLSLKVTITPSDATNSSVSWASGNTKIATVNSNGTITAVSEGETTITVKSKDSGITATCKVAVTAEYVDFPDPNFRKYMIENFDLNKNGKISLMEAKKVTHITVSSENIESLKGIESLDNLSVLRVGTSLGGVSYGRNTDGTIYYNPSNPPGKLKSLDLSNNTHLSYLSCYNNIIAELDLSNNNSLTTLDCQCNQITKLSLSPKASIVYLNCSFNKLVSLDIESSLITGLSCEGNYLKELDISVCYALKDLRCGYNQLTALNVTKNTELQTLYCWNNQLTSLDVSRNTALTSLLCNSNQLTTLDVTKNTGLQTLYCSSNQLMSLDVSRNTALTYLSCNSNQLTTIDVTKNASLTNLNCSSNKLRSLGVSKNTALTYLACSSNQLTSLDVSKNSALTTLYCYSNQLTSLDVSKNSSLTKLDCSPMSTLRMVYVASGQNIDGVTTNRNSSYIPSSTSIVTK